jgi:two-component system sensor histidine kinase ChvG
MTTLPHLARVDALPKRDRFGQSAAESVVEEPATPEASVPAMTGFAGSPLTRRIVLVNLVVVVVLTGLLLFANPFRQAITEQRQQGLVSEARLIAALLGTSLAQGGATGAAVSDALAAASMRPEQQVFLFDQSGGLLGRSAERDIGQEPSGPAGWSLAERLGSWHSGSRMGTDSQTADELARSLVRAAHGGATALGSSRDPATGARVLAAAAPVRPGNEATEVVVLTALPDEIVRIEGAAALQLLAVFGGAILVSTVLSLGLAASITGPLAALASAAEQGRDRHARKMTRGRVRIPDLAERPDEIGRLSKAMRGMVAALYDRIDANEQFAADVAHEIKNPLASLRAAVGTLRVSPRDDQRERLLDVITHDVRRLDRLVSDISNASRLDSDLVREESVRFNLLRTLAALGDHLGRQAAETGVEFITDLPPEPILVDGLEERLAQVFVNLVTNAISFCDEGDAVRLWSRRRENRVLIVVEDTGPGIPEAALGKVFERFYSERPELDFGNHSGLGLAISKQIVEAHGGVIWAENIRPTHADITSEPLGARFVVGLPV